MAATATHCSANALPTNTISTFDKTDKNDFVVILQCDHFFIGKECLQSGYSFVFLPVPFSFISLIN